MRPHASSRPPIVRRNGRNAHAPGWRRRPALPPGRQPPDAPGPPGQRADGLALAPPRSGASSRLAVTELGASGPTVVFLPGLGATSRYWEPRVAPLADSYHLVLVDLLGFGRSPKPWTRYTIERHVDELHRVLDGRGPVALVGHSFGCTVGLAYAARHPDLVSRLALVSPPYFGGPDRAVAYVRRTYAPIGWILTNVAFAAVACMVTRRVLRRLLPYLLTDLPREVVEDLVRHSWRSFTSTLWEGIYRYDPAADAARLPARLPVLIVHGEQDPTAPCEGARTLAALHPGATLRVLPGCDHHPLLRRPAWCLETLRAFLRPDRAPAPEPAPTGALAAVPAPLG